MPNSDKSLEDQVRDIRNLLREPLALCAWGGCAARFDPEKLAPAGWVALLFRARRIRRFAFAPPCFVQNTRRSSMVC